MKTAKMFTVLIFFAALSACGFSMRPSIAIDAGGGDGGSGYDAGEFKVAPSKPKYFDAYILKAVDVLFKKYKLLGYDIHSLYTHDLPYGKEKLAGTPGPKTMCVAAQVEVILTAMELYVKETGDKSVYDFLPIKSWKGLTVNDIKGHIWVNKAFDSHGTADALNNFGMGEVVAFEDLRPGGFINFNRANGSGHAVTFISFIDKMGKEYATYTPYAIGFKYFSAQGMKDPDGGGLDYRYAVFVEHGCPIEIPGKRDCEILYSRNRTAFNAGRMWTPAAWKKKPRAMNIDLGESVFDPTYFTGVTTD